MGETWSFTPGRLHPVPGRAPFPFETPGNRVSTQISNHRLSWSEDDEVEVRLSQNWPATGAPTVTGAAQVTRTLAVDISGITDADGIPEDAAYTFKWSTSDDGATYTDVEGATGATYTLASSDEGRTIKVEVGFTDSVGFEETVASAASGQIAEAPPVNSPATGQPTISGTLEVSRILTANTAAIQDQNGISAAAYSYQWLRLDSGTETEIAGATSPTYGLAAADQGKTIKVKVSFTDGEGYSESLTSAATGQIAAATNSPTTSKPTIKGAPARGETLEADTTGITDENGIPGDVSYTYQWLRVDGGTETEITGATSHTYQLVEADLGKTIKVKVGFTDLGGFSESLTSDATGAVSVSTLITEGGYAPGASITSTPRSSWMGS